jgi:hypothetical protein
MGLDNIPVSPNIILSMRKTIERFPIISEAPPLASLESISTPISDLATQITDDPADLEMQSISMIPPVQTIPVRGRAQSCPV